MHVSSVGINVVGSSGEREEEADYDLEITQKNWLVSYIPVYSYPADFVSLNAK